MPGSRDTTSPRDAFASTLRNIADRLKALEARVGNGVPTASIVWWPGGAETTPLGYIGLPSPPVPIARYGGLYAVLGARYGSGDGTGTTFALPGAADLPPAGPGGFWIIRT